MRGNVLLYVNPWVQALVSGAFIGIAFLFPPLWFFPFFAIALLIRIVTHAQSPLRAFLYGYCAGLVADLFLFAILFWPTIPLDWFGIHGFGIQAIGAGGSWISLSVVVATAQGLFGLCAYLLKTDTWLDALVLPSVWVLSEVASTFIFFVVWLGSGSFFGIHFTMHWVGYILASDSIFLQLASLGGVYVLSFVTVCIAVLFLRFVSLNDSLHKRTYGIVLVCIFCIWGMGHVLHASGILFVSQQTPMLSTQSLQVAVISRYVPPTLVQDFLFQKARVDEMYRVIGDLRNVDLLVFPEDTTFVESMHNEDFTHGHIALDSLGPNGNTPHLIDSGDVYTENGPLYSQATMLYNNVWSTVAQKQFLLPLGEYIPGVYELILRLTGQHAFLETVTRMRGYSPGINARNTLIDGALVAFRFCDEAMSPELFRTQVVDGAQVLVNLSSLSWFHGTTDIYENMLRIAKVRAVENNRWFAQSGDMSPAFILDQYGNIEAQTPWYKLAVAQRQVLALHTMTLYTRFGYRQLLLYVVIVLVRLVLYARQLMHRHS